MFAETHALALAARRATGVVDGLRIDHPDGLADPAGYLERCATAAPRTCGWRRSSIPASGCATGPSRARSATSSSSTSRRCSSIPPARRALTALWEELAGDAPAVRRVGGGGQARAGGDDLRAGRRVAAAAGPTARTGSRRRWPRCRSTAPTSAAAAGARGPARCCARPGCEWLRLRRRAGRVRDALPADDAAGDGQGRRGHGLLPLRPPARAQRRRRRPRPLRHRAWTPSTPPTPSAPRASRATCSSSQPTTRSARATSARGSARWPGWRGSGRAVRALARLRAPLRRGGAPDAVEEYTILQTLVGAWPIEPDRLCAYLEKAMRERKLTRTGSRRTRSTRRRVLGYGRALYGHGPFLADFEPFAERRRRRGRPHRAAPDSRSS